MTKILARKTTVQRMNPKTRIAAYRTITTIFACAQGEQADHYESSECARRSTSHHSPGVAPSSVWSLGHDESDRRQAVKLHRGILYCAF